MLLITIIVIINYPHQHKAAVVKTNQNVKQRLQRLLFRCSLCKKTACYNYNLVRLIDSINQSVEIF